MFLQSLPATSPCQTSPRPRHWGGQWVPSRRSRGWWPCRPDDPRRCWRECLPSRYCSMIAASTLLTSTWRINNAFIESVWCFCLSFPDVGCNLQGRLWEMLQPIMTGDSHHWTVGTHVCYTSLSWLQFRSPVQWHEQLNTPTSIFVVVSHSSFWVSKEDQQVLLTVSSCQWLLQIFVQAVV